MKIFRRIEEITADYRSSVATIGNFDGIHLAHQEILHRVVREARERKTRSMVITFDPHPQRVLHPEKRPFYLLTTLDEKMKLIEALGIDAVLLITFTRDFSTVTAEAFVREILWDKLRVQKVFIGHDYAFGNRKQGNEEFLRSRGGVLGFDVESINTFTVHDTVVSSTNIRMAILNGDVRKAALLLGRPYSVGGTVIRGYQRGREIGIPTANIEPGKELLPANGVYAVGVDLEGVRHAGVLNVGFNPTFSNEKLSVEVHIMNFDGELYGRALTVSFIERIRSEMRFENPQKLAEQILRDKAKAEEILARVARPD
ncbi:MAG TPA: bifunctional riboflavin kinase/FAD synthetase [Syntrophales bacterium]|jgi:riboflavin kinase/FMN adenylyltransferase|nr:bifunctional riboflavin kinase/FAD synthetase [Syntrophales bacterium]